MATQDESVTFEDLVTMSMDERVAYFLRHPVPVQGRLIQLDPMRVAQFQARSVDTIAKREAELGQP